MDSIKYFADVDWMSFPERFMELRKKHGLTQQQMSSFSGVHISQIKRYESGEAQPSMDALKKIAVAFNISIDSLVFEKDEREPKDELKLRFEAVAQMDEEEQRSVLSFLDAMILKNQTKRFFLPKSDH